MADWPLAREAEAIRGIPASEMEALREQCVSRGELRRSQPGLSGSGVDEEGEWDVSTLELDFISDTESVVEIDARWAVFSLPLGELVGGLRSGADDGGVEIKRRKYHLRKYDACFVGSEAVDWLMGAYPDVVADRATATEVLDQLVKLDIVHHVCDDHPFRDGYYFYRFRIDEATHALNAARLSTGPPPAADELVDALRSHSATLFAALLTPDGHLSDAGLADVRASPAFKIVEADAVRLQQLDLGALDELARKAFFINLYNVLVVHAMAVHGRPVSWLARGSFFRRKAAYLVGTHTFSLAIIEHGILRANTRQPLTRKPLLKEADPRAAWVISSLDPRIHFALNCGARSCPPIRVYNPDALELQLELAAELFCESEAWVVPPGTDASDADDADAAAAAALAAGTVPSRDAKWTVSLSKIFDWYATDFGPTRPAMLDFIARYVNRRRAAVLRDLVAAGAYRITYRAYDWHGV